jgi:hypothetical protein
MNNSTYSAASVALTLGYYFSVSQMEHGQHYTLTNTKTWQSTAFKSLDGVVSYLEVRQEQVNRALS